MKHTAYFGLVASLCMLMAPHVSARTVETERFILTPELVTPFSQSQIDSTQPIQAVQESTAVPIFTISYDMSLLPMAVQKTRDRLIKAAQNADWEQLQAVITDNNQVPVVSFDEIDDPVAYLRELSGDEKGHEILAILLEVLRAGYARVEAGTDREVFIWPYFARMSLEQLTPTQRVELFTLVTAGDYENMLDFGAYNFFRLGISPDGTWQFFIAGD